MSVTLVQLQFDSATNVGYLAGGNRRL